MKKILSSLLVAFALAASANAQIVKGDMNDDQSLTMQDANAIVNVFVTGQTATTLSVVPMADYEALEKENVALREELHQLKDFVNGHEFIDLGLSVKWATCNVGASKPEEYGNYFAWGEVEPKSDYSWSTYFDTTDNGSTFTKYNNGGGKTVLEPEDDAAHANWGGSWRMPTKAEQDELRNNCTWTWTTQSGVNGYKVTSKTNSNSIFLPAAGYRNDTSLINAGFGYCWSASLDASDASYSSSAYFLFFISGIVDWSGSYRYYGNSVRPVCPE